MKSKLLSSTGQKNTLRRLVEAITLGSAQFFRNRAFILRQTDDVVDMTFLGAALLRDVDAPGWLQGDNRANYD